MGRKASPQSIALNEKIKRLLAEPEGVQKQRSLPVLKPYLLNFRSGKTYMLRGMWVEVTSRVRRIRDELNDQRLAISALTGWLFDRGVVPYAPKHPRERSYILVDRLKRRDRNMAAYRQMVETTEAYQHTVSNSKILPSGTKHDVLIAGDKLIDDNRDRLDIRNTGTGGKP